MIYFKIFELSFQIQSLKEESDAVIVEIQPRFPLFGGWKTQYSLSYKLPPGEILSLDGSKYVMSTRFVVNGIVTIAQTLTLYFNIFFIIFF